MDFEKRVVNVPLIVLLTLGVITILLAGSFIYFSINGPNYSKDYSKKIKEGQIENPITKFGLSSEDIGSEEIEEEGQIITINTEEGVKRIIIKSKNIGNLTIKEIQEELINYVSVILEFYNLHSVPFFGITPKIQIYIDNNAYYIEILKGDILIKEDVAQEPDIIIRTTYEEIFKIIEDNNYAKESLSSGKIKIEIVASKFILFSKGYLTLYNKLAKSF